MCVRVAPGVPMIQNVSITSRQNLLDRMDNGTIARINRPFILISIFGEEGPCIGDFNKVKLGENCKGVLELFFADVEPSDGFDTDMLFREEHAFKIIEFVNRHKHNANHVIVHCMAGISRSGAVGQWIVDYLKLNKDHFKIANPWICPNAHVYMILAVTSGLVRGADS